MSVVVGWCHPIEVAAGFADSLLDVFVHDMNGPRHIVGRLPQFSSANVSWARNQIVQRFLTMDDGEPDWLFMVDSDMILPERIVDLLLEQADPDESPIVGALCFTLDSGGEVWPTIYQVGNHPELGPRMIRLDDYPPNTLETVAATGAACLLIHRRVLQAVGEAQVNAGNTAFPWFEEMSLGLNGAKTYPVGEDITFCLRAGALHFPTKVWTGVEVGHQKAYLLTSALHREQRSRAHA